MFKPNEFIRSVAPSEGAIKYVLKHYWGYVNVKEYCNVLEIGCGPGNCTHDILLPLFPKTLQNYVGTDISRPMIEYAQTHYQNEPRLKFEMLDVGTYCLPKKFLAAFDHILSFQCLHFVSDHRKALENIYQMTKPGGDLFITFAGKAIIFDVYEELSQSDKWRPYLESYRDAVCPTHFCEDPSLYFEAVLKEVGFSPVVCISLKKHFVLPKKSFLTFVEAICMYPIPKNLMDNFLADSFEEMKRRRCVDGDYVTYPYSLLIAHATKPDGTS
ncbi:hypothetical protein RI129_012390 [Pyrocoelia pectoralis]|uniref:Methyltransferase type 12 domain-containing protein n=1 Tax=Pyrocoelia pectoralis TaxID=417401 RepID=A0AAN7UT50_9COLE